MSETSDASRQPLMLIVEDRDVMRAMLHEFVQNAFPACAILDAATGGHAMKLCAEHRPDLVLMDVNLPDANGIELTTRVRIQWPTTRVIVFSYLGTDAHVERASIAGAFAYVAKDRLIPDLIPAITGALGIARSSAPGDGPPRDRDNPGADTGVSRIRESACGPYIRRPLQKERMP